MKPLFVYENQILMIDLANFAARAFSLSKTHEHFFALFIRMLLKYRKTFRNYQFFFAQEGNGKERRRELFPEYKRGRRESIPISEDVVSKYLELIGFLRCTILQAPNGEADDAIASYTAQHTKFDADHVVIATEDKDLWQLVKDPNLCVLSGRNGIITESEIYKRTGGLKPRQIRLQKAFLGDASDNLPRVPKVAVKTITRIVQQSATLKDAYAVIRDARWLFDIDRKRLLEYRPQISTNYNLVRLRRKLRLQFIEGTPHPTKCKRLLNHLGVSDALDDNQLIQLVQSHAN